MVSPDTMYTQTTKTASAAYICTVVKHTHVTIIIKEEEALNLRVGYMGGVGEGIGRESLYNSVLF